MCHLNRPKSSAVLLFVSFANERGFAISYENMIACVTMGIMKFFKNEGGISI
jgi:hypothetical protein